MTPRIIVTDESDSGRNLYSHDNSTNQDMTRAQFIKEIKQGNYDGYHIRHINGLDIPVSNPDGKESNNLD